MGDIILMYLSFALQAVAITAVTVINVLLGYPNAGTKTTTWAVPRQAKDGTWVIPNPGPASIVGVIGSTLNAAVTWPDRVGSP